MRDSGYDDSFNREGIFCYSLEMRFGNVLSNPLLLNALPTSNLPKKNNSPKCNQQLCISWRLSSQLMEYPEIFHWE